jgi:hypothetical protein
MARTRLGVCVLEGGIREHPPLPHQSTKAPRESGREAVRAKLIHREQDDEVR